MTALRCLLGIAAMAALACGAVNAAHARPSDYPTKPVTIISDAAPDVDARFIADALGKMWGTQVIMVNHPGANGSVAATEAVPDGDTLYAGAGADQQAIK